MTHNRKYVTGGIDLVGTKMRSSLNMMDQDKVEQLIIDGHFLDNAPFKFVSLANLYGIKNALIPRCVKIDKEYNAIDIEIELKTEVLEWADRNNIQLLYHIFMIGALEALMHAGNKYNLPIDIFVKERAKYGIIPETIEECKNYIPSTEGPSKLWLYLNAYCAQQLKDLGIYDEFHEKKYEEESSILKLVIKYPNEIFLNWCPNCGNLKKTQKARQCLECMTFTDPVHELGLNWLHKSSPAN